MAQKSGVVAYLCDQDAGGRVPASLVRAKIEREVTKSVQEHIIIYTDAARTVQVWQYVLRQEGRPVTASEHTYHAHQSGEAMAQKLERLVINLDKDVTLLDVLGGVKDGMVKEQVTKRFYERFQKEHAAFLGFIQGIAEQVDREWYASLMLNRLMFVYFIQRKGFLDGDLDYLRTRLGMERHVPFLSFYKYFLRHLFHEGLSRRPAERQPHLDRLLGRIPYLNGGLFDLHALETKNPDVDIADEAFARVFDFFDAYTWHLNDGPLGADNEINPDVLGYIFEKYINQKQMGAYYTKEDVTGYMARSTIIPHLFDAARDKCPIAFDPDGYVWRLLRDNPDRYIYAAVRKGVDIPLPEIIEAGQNDVAQRGGWNRLANSALGLVAARSDGTEPVTETWRECVARRDRYREVYAHLISGKVCSIDEVITLNLDIQQFTQDVIGYCEGADLLWAFYQAIETIAILDPTCGSGAFNFAALNVLEPLYEACLTRMQGFRDDADSRSDHAAHRTPVYASYEHFRRVLEQVDVQHPNRRYFIYKSIIMNNLYGVDIMEEAVEICKLRLFLKLASQLNSGDDIEPLPDIDFNIRPGNTLVGFATRGEVERAVLGDVQAKMDLNGDMPRITAKAERADQHFQRFRALQATDASGTDEIKEAKADLRAALDELRDELDHYLASEYGISSADVSKYDEWRTIHRPFHWYVAFYAIMQRGGFDVVIGNPPYIVYSPSKVPYQVEPQQYRTRDTKNLCNRTRRVWSGSCSEAEA